VKVVSLITLILFSSYVQASAYKVKKEECSNIDIRDQHPHLKKHFSTPLDQGSIGWCYGYSAADLLSVEAGEAISPSHVSSIYNKSVRSNFLWKVGYNISTLFTKKETYEGGFIGKATVEAMEESPLCKYNDMDRYTHRINLLEVTKQRVKNKQMSMEDACVVLERTLPNINTDSKNFMEDFISKNLNDSLESLLRENCQTVEVPERKKRVLYKPFIWGKKKHVDRVNKLLEKGKPLGVAYNVSHVTKNLSGYHASTVIGRRWNNGRCEYNIRNSWGRTCNYKPGIECNRDDGSFWVKDEDFYKLALNFTYLE